MAAYIIYDNDGNIKSMLLMSILNAAKQRKGNDNLAQIDKPEIGLDKKYKVQLDDKNKPIINMTGTAKLQRRFDRGFPMTEK